MKIVIDTNTVISAFGWGGKPDAVMGRVIDGLDTLFITDDIIREFETTIKKPRLDAIKEQTASMMDIIKKYSQKVTVSTEHKATGASRDKDDDMYLECAIAANADYIVSGDKHLRELKAYKNIKIVNASEYLDTVGAA